MNASRWWSTVRYHRPAQLAHRAAAILYRRVFPFLPHSRYTRIDRNVIARRICPGFDVLTTRHLDLRTARDVAPEKTVADLLGGSFVFLNERRTLPQPIDWSTASIAPVSHLWRFHLHYQEYLLDLLAASRGERCDDCLDALWAIIADWIQSNPITRRGALTDAWHPFCLSRRIAVWLMIWHATDPPGAFQETFAASLEGQIRFLERHLERDLGGNHLLENLRTLAMAGAFFDGVVADRRLKHARRLLESEFSRQILPSGEHFERSPMYHAQMLSAVLDVRDATSAIDPRFSSECAEVARRMATFLEHVTHPDGEVSHFADTATGEVPSVEVLVRAAGDKPRDGDRNSEARVLGDYWKWQDGSDVVLFDAGPVGADELPAHAHCDLLTFEASIGGKRLFVDSGVYDYSDGEMRHYCRSTAAHNVLQIDGAEQCDMWSRFRMGVRGHPGELKSGVAGPFSWCRATHNAYRRIGVPVTGRWIACHPGGPWFCVDWAEGSGRHQLVDRLHLSPDADLTAESPGCVRIEWDGRSIVVRSLNETPVTIGKAWYCPDFGIRLESPVLEIRADGHLPAAIGWAIQTAEDPRRATLHVAKNGQVRLHWQDGVTQMNLDFTGSENLESICEYRDAPSVQ